MADRSTFLERIREATARGRAHRAEVNPLATHTAAYVGGGADPVESLLTEWRAVGGQGDRVPGRDAARTYLAAFIRRHAVQSVLRWKHPLLEQLGIDEILAETGATVTGWEELEAEPAEVRWRRAFSPQLGITSVDWAIAETGSMVLCSRPGQGRVVSLLPPRYLAIVEPAQIVPDLFDLYERLELEKESLPSNVVLVTGPSKTGDIELKLTTGVHGPGEVHLLVVES